MKEKELTFFDHLEELRWHLIRIILAILLFSLLSFIFKDVVFNTIIFGPANNNFYSYEAWCKLVHKLHLSNNLCFKPINFEIINTEMAGQFVTHIKVAFYVGLILAFPYTIFELWRFVSPALYEKERKASSRAIFICSILFYIGVIFAYFILIPFSLDFLSHYNVSYSIKNTFTLTNYINFLSTLLLATGIMFELPVAVYVLAKLGIISASMMKKYWRYAFVITLVISALITPPDIASMILVGIPLFGLYIISIFIASRINP